MSHEQCFMTDSTAVRAAKETLIGQRHSFDYLLPYAAIWMSEKHLQTFSPYQLALPSKACLVCMHATYHLHAK